MSNELFIKGREGFTIDAFDWDTGAFDIALIDVNTADVGIKAVTGATNATPIVLTITAHGFANGDFVVIGGVGGNLAANGVWKVAAQAANTINLTDPITDANVAGSAAYTSGGYAVCLGPSAAGDNWDDFDGALVGTVQALAGKTGTNGFADATDPSFPTVTGASVEALIVKRNTGAAATDRMIAFLDGRQIVTCAAQAAATATSVAVERLQSAIPNSTVLTFSNGASATLSAVANAGDRTITVTSLAAIITAGARADAPRTGSGLPITPNGGTINFTIDALGLFRL